MASIQRANPKYAEDVNAMILEYLIYSTIEAVIQDFRNQGSHSVASEQSGLIKLKILLGMIRQ